MSGRGEWCMWIVIDVKIDTKVCDLGEDVVNLRFELGVENNVTETFG